MFGAAEWIVKMDLFWALHWEAMSPSQLARHWAAMMPEQSTSSAVPASATYLSDPASAMYRHRPSAGLAGETAYMSIMDTKILECLHAAVNNRCAMHTQLTEEDDGSDDDGGSSGSDPWISHVSYFELSPEDIERCELEIQRGL